jgi:hypothetical protein
MCRASTGTTGKAEVTEELEEDPLLDREEFLWLKGLSLPKTLDVAKLEVDKVSSDELRDRNPSLRRVFEVGEATIADK